MTSLFVYAFPFFTSTPEMLCREEGSGEWTPCAREIACGLGYGKDGGEDYAKIDWENIETIDNWVVRTNLVCQTHFKVRVGLFGTSMMTGFLLGSIILTPQFDVFGRKKINLLLCAI